MVHTPAAQILVIMYMFVVHEGKVMGEPPYLWFPVLMFMSYFEELSRPVRITPAESVVWLKFSVDVPLL